jgi:hypothetical protein
MIIILINYFILQNWQVTTFEINLFTWHDIIVATLINTLIIYLGIYLFHYVKSPLDDKYFGLMWTQVFVINYKRAVVYIDWLIDFLRLKKVGVVKDIASNNHSRWALWMVPSQCI